MMISGINIPILCYHSIDDTGSLISIEPSLFEKQMKYLRRNHYTVLSMIDMLRLLQTEKEISHKTVVITFDDGYKNNYTFAFPLLKSFGFSATVFLTTGYVGGKAGWIQRDVEEMFLDKEKLFIGQVDHSSLNTALLEKRIPYLLTLPQKQLASEIEKLLKVGELPMFGWKEAQEMSQYGIEFGAHSHTHPLLNELTLADAGREIKRSKDDIEKYLKKTAHSFCYPYGAFNPEVTKLVKDYGFLGACSSQYRANNIKTLDVFALNRFMVSNSLTMSTFRLRISRFDRYYFAIKQGIKSILIRN